MAPRTYSVKFDKVTCALGSTTTTAMEHGLINHSLEAFSPGIRNEHLMGCTDLCWHRSRPGSVGGLSAQRRNPSQDRYGYAKGPQVRRSQDSPLCIGDGFESNLLRSVSHFPTDVIEAAWQ
jgi:hypothetical protein